MIDHPDEDDDDFDEEDFLGEDEFEDPIGMAAILKEHGVPETWHVVKVVAFTARSLIEQGTWLDEKCTGIWKQLGWSSNCSTKVAIAFEQVNDAILYKMRWQG